MFLYKILVVINTVVLVTLAMNATDLLAVNTLADGEIELLIKYHGITAKETSVSSRSKNKITLRQLTDGKHFIQLIYDGNDRLRDCEYVHINGQIATFLEKFQESLFSASNITNAVPSSITNWLHYTKLRKLCKKTHQDMKMALKRKYNGVQLETRLKKKRSINEYLIAPGTLWCGYDDIAESYTSLGALSSTDRCCRKHDHCQDNIKGFGSKYHLYNARPITLSNCWCDNSFRACLKMADTSDANLVGKLFFNVVQTKCFVLKPKKICAKRSWWGKCTKKKYIKQAILRDNLSY